MTDKRLLLSTAGSREEANRIASELVGRRLVACVNIVGPMTSCFRWKSKVQTSEEFLLIIKTTVAQFAAVRDAILELHSYELPELIQIPIENGLEEYLNWIAESVDES